jgi:heterodisulfide reductase subunit A
MGSPRVGVYICHCGINISATVNVTQVAESATQLPGVVVARDYAYMCSDPGQELIKKDIANLKLNRVVVASCSPRMHEATFRSCIAAGGLNPYCLEMANIREQCSWVHEKGDDTTQKAEQLVAAAVAKAYRLEPLEIHRVPVLPTTLVIGGGITGMQAALDIAEAGFQAILVEASPGLGGHAAQLHQLFPTLEPARDLVEHLRERVIRHPRITVLLSAQVREVNGYVGNFRARIQQGEISKELPAGTIIVATGYNVFDAHRKPEFGYGTYPEVITTLDLEDDLNHSRDLSHLKSIVFIQCVGSRDQTLGNPYCSRVCCMVTAKQAYLLRQKLPDARVSVLYMDVRTFGKGCEEFYDRVREAGVLYRRSNPAEIIRKQGKLFVRFEDTLTGKPEEIPADLVVLAVGLEPGPGTSDIAQLLKLPRSTDGFLMEAHPKLRPVDTATAGVLIAGCCQGPKDMGDSLAQARAASAAALALSIRGQVVVEAAISFIVDPDRCSGCGQCAQVCPYSAISLHPFRNVMRINTVLCQGCGACLAACPSGVINVYQFSFEEVLAQINAFSKVEFA